MLNLISWIWEVIMKKHKKTEQEIKILEGMEQVREKLIAFKKRMNSELVILQDNKVIRVKP